ncbi:DUF927 domain-containing protein [Ancylobacter sp. WKF20]|uniref:DUF927 domain-containing protein n=1 Tax=Ancylobacter sp. WKF20 TaxID=3039801 RepID=UPI0024345F87|nr:DUF927 domain-containing protein [Ancylobacter sp. WKF20]WGD29876.1 DUF927 domain-containing protein [Ancylobacter sp. WKF20]
MTTTTCGPLQQDDILQRRRNVWANGFRPVPVRTGEKVPAEAKWPDRARLNPPACVGPDAAISDAALNTGILADGLSAIDADIDDEATAEAVWRLATDMLGEAPVRFRDDSHRFLLLYRAAEGEPRKLVIRGEDGAVEVLGRGQQFVAFGWHPSGAEYRWSADSPETRHRDKLMPVTEQQVAEFLAACAPIIDAQPFDATPSTVSVSTSTIAAPSGVTTAWGRAAMDAECDRIACAAPGTQSDTLASAAYKVGQRIASGEIVRDDAERALLAAGMQMTNGNPKRRWSQRGVLDVIKRQIDAGFGSPIGPDRIADRVFVDLDGSFDRKPEPADSKPASMPTRVPIVPVPADAPVMGFKHPKWGEPQWTWPYRDAAGQLVGYVVRWSASDVDPEHVAHITYCDLGPGKRAAWRMKPMPAPRPMFNLPAILSRPDAPVLICPDEWSVEAATMLMPDMVATTTAHDTKSPALTDFSPIIGRSIILVPTIGREGQAWADMIADQSARAGAGNVKALDLTRVAGGILGDAPPPDDGWGIVDAVDAGVTAEVLADLIKTDAEVISFHLDERQKRNVDAVLNPELVLAAEEVLPLFKSDSTGVFKLCEFKEMGESRREYRWFCSPLTVVAQTRDADGRNWGRLLRVLDRDGRSSEWAMPMELLAGDGSEYRRELLRMGLIPAPGNKAREHLHEFICTQRPKQKARCVSRTGWHGRTYVTVDQAIDSGSASEQLLLQTAVPPDHPFRTAGSLSHWQQDVARYAVGNSRLGLAISAALAAPLLYPLDAEGGGFHLRGGSSTGKSTALVVGGSVWGGGGLNGFLRTWRATTNGLEGVAALHCDALLCLDEMGQVDGREAGSIAYMLANGTGKSRAGRSGEARSAASWRVLFLSSGEVSLADKLAEDGRARRAAAGQEVRIVDIPADAGGGLGLFEDLHGFDTADGFSRHLKTAAARHYGHASRAFLKMVVERFDDVQRDARAFCDQFVRDHCPDGADGQISRVAARFGLVAAAGEIAREAGTLPWPEGEAMRAAAQCFHNWLAQRGGIEPAEERNAIAQVRHFIEQHGASRFEPIGDVRDHAETRVINRVGFRVGDASNGYEYIVLPEAWKTDICAGMDASFVTKVLAKRGFLKVGSDGKAQTKYRLPGFKQSVRCYVLSSTIIEGAES